MRHTGWKWALMVVSLGWPLLTNIPAEAEDLASPPPQVAAKAVELVDGQSGQVLYQKNAYQELPMASVTKLMTLCMAIKAIQQRKMSLGDLVPVSYEAYQIKGSQIWLEPGERLTVDHLLKGIAIGSANDAAYALGEYIAGSPGAFVEDMNNTARQWGMTSTHFANPHGLHEATHYTTAHDLSILAEHAVKMPLLLHYTAMWEDRTIRNGKGGTLWLINHNRLLRQYPGMDGLKTGYTGQAGFCMAATAHRDGTRMIAVVLGAPSSKIRFQDAATLLTWGFQHYRSVTIAQKGALVGTVRVLRGSSRSVDAVVAHNGYLTLSRDAGDVKRQVVLTHTITAPVNRGQVLGFVVARQKGHEILRVPIVAKTAIPHLGWLGNAWRFLWQIAG